MGERIREPLLERGALPLAMAFQLGELKGAAGGEALRRGAKGSVVLLDGRGGIQAERSVGWNGGGKTEAVSIKQRYFLLQRR